MSAPSITLSPGGGFLLEPTGSVTIFTPEMLSEEQRMMKETADDFLHEGGHAARRRHRVEEARRHARA